MYRYAIETKQDEKDDQVSNNVGYPDPGCNEKAPMEA
jgi:hypothetical protein